MANLRKKKRRELDSQIEASAELQPRVAIYARVSTDAQAKEDTIARQLVVTRERYKSLFEKNDAADFVGIFQDEGYNAEIKDETRDYWKLLSLIKAKRVNTVIAAASDRIFRGESAALRGEVTDILRHYNVRLITSSEDIVYRVTDTSGRIASAVVQELGAIAKLEAGRLLQTGRIRKLVELDQWRLTNVPYGYRVKKTGNRENPFAYTTVKDEALIVEDIYRLYVGMKPTTLFHSLVKASLSVYDIADILNSNGVSRSTWAAGVPAAKDGPWNRNHVLQILQNETYTGRLIVSFKAQPKFNIPRTTKEIKVPALIDTELFERASLKYRTYHEKLIRNKRPRGSERWLHRMVLCQTCSSPLIAKRHGRNHPLYSCSLSDGHRMYRAADLEAMVAREFRELVADDSLIEAIITKINGVEKEDVGGILKQLDKLEAQVKEKQDLLDKLTEKWGLGRIDDSTYDRVRGKNLGEIETLDKTRIGLLATLSEKQSSSDIKRSNISVENVQIALKKVFDSVADAGAFGRDMRIVLESLVSHIEIEKADELDIKAMSDEDIKIYLGLGRLVRREVAAALNVSMTTAKRRWPGSFGMRTNGRGVDYKAVLKFR